MKLKDAINGFTKWKAPQVKGNTIYHYHWQLVNFAMFLHNKDIEDVNEKDILEYLNLSQDFNHSASTREKQALAIKHLLSYWQLKGLNVEKPELVPKIRSERVMPRVATDSDYYKVLNVIPASGYNHIRNRAIIALLNDTGARLNEILGLNIQDIDLETKRITVRTEKHTKTAPFRNIFYREATIVYLKTWLQKREEILERLRIEDKDALFISVVGGACGEGTNARRFSIDGAGEVLRKYSKMAGLKSVFNAHSLRHKLGRVLAENEVDDLLIAQMLGHNSVDSSRIYTELFGPALQKIYQKVMGK